MFRYNAMPLGLFIIVMLAGSVILIVEERKIQKKYPNHPIKYMFWPLSVTGVLMCLYRFVQEYPINETVDTIARIAFWIGFASTLIGFVVCMYVAVKTGLMPKDRWEKLKPFLTTNGIIIAVGIVILIILVNFIL